MKSLKLYQIEKNVLSTNEMRQVKGGSVCICGCKYAEQGGSSSWDNGTANRNAKDKDLGWNNGGTSNELGHAHISLT